MDSVFSAKTIFDFWKMLLEIAFLFHLFYSFSSLSNFLRFWKKTVGKLQMLFTAQKQCFPWNTFSVNVPISEIYCRFFHIFIFTKEIFRVKNSHFLCSVCYVVGRSQIQPPRWNLQVHGAWSDVGLCKRWYHNSCTWLTLASVWYRCCGFLCRIKYCKVSLIGIQFTTS